MRCPGCQGNMHLAQKNDRHAVWVCGSCQRRRVKPHVSGTIVLERRASDPIERRRARERN